MLDISNLKRGLSDRPTIICDVDEVVVEFLTPFRSFLNSQNLDLTSTSFALHGNVISQETGIASDNQMVSYMIDELFANQKIWQTAVQTAAETLHEISNLANIVFLTAMPPDHYDVRRELLDSFDMPFPLLATNEAKGPLINELIQDNNHPSFFIDDMIYNHNSTREHSPETHNIYIMANDEFRTIAPEVHPDTFNAADWAEIKDFIFDKI